MTVFWIKLLLLFSLSFALPAGSAQAAIILNELLPDPSGNESASNPEFVEIFNPDSTSINISNWSITDLKNNKFATIPEGTIISSNAFLVFYKSRTLNNSGEEIVYLRDAASNIIDQITYNNAVEGKSYSRVSSFWEWLEPTPNAPNKILTENPQPTNQETLPSQSPSYTQNNNTENSNSTSSPLIVSVFEVPDSLPYSPPINPLPLETNTSQEISQNTLSNPLPAQNSEPTSFKKPTKEPEQEELPSSVLAQETNSSGANLSAQINQQSEPESKPISLASGLIIALLAGILGVLISNKFKKTNAQNTNSEASSKS